MIDVISELSINSIQNIQGFNFITNDRPRRNV
jgi:hypothetical protein